MTEHGFATGETFCYGNSKKIKDDRGYFIICRNHNFFISLKLQNIQNNKPRTVQILYV